MSDEVKTQGTQTGQEPQYVRMEELEKVRKQLDGISYLGRKLEEVTRRLDTMPEPRVVPQTQQENKDELDELVEKDWKQAVRKLSRNEMVEYEREKQLEFARQQEETKKISILEQSKNAVKDKYPEVDDTNSEFAKKFISVRNKHPEYWKSEYGPILAMREVEEELRKEGKLDSETKEVVEKEAMRITRTKVGSTPVGTNGKVDKNKVVLTSDEREFCDFNGISYENFAKNKKLISNKEGVSA